MSHQLQRIRLWKLFVLWLSVVKAALVSSHYCRFLEPAHLFACGGLVSGSGWVVFFRRLPFGDGADVDDGVYEAFAHRCCIPQLEYYLHFAAVLKTGSARLSDLRYLFQPYLTEVLKGYIE